MSLLNAVRHFRTITKHKMLVMKGCFQVGLFCQGLLHDLSKYSPEEFVTGEIFSGNQEPERGGKGGKGVFRGLAPPQGAQ